MPVLNGKALIEERIAAIRAMHEATGVKRAELDLSGGIDSACMLGLLVGALGADNLTVVHSRINTNPEQTARANALAKALGVKLIDIDLTEIFEGLVAEMRRSMHYAGYPVAEIDQRIKSDPTILGSIRSCIRAPIGRGFNRLAGNGIRHGTGNEDEDRFLRFYQKGGDGEVDTNPIAMLSKTEVFQLAHALGEYFPQARAEFRAHIRAKPSADLWANGDEQNDESEIHRWTGVAFTYGKINPETGEVLSVGTIERVSRFLDVKFSPIALGGGLVQDVLFGIGNVRSHLVPRAQTSGFFEGFSDDQIEALLLAARKSERATRHKAAPQIPTLGTREDLVAADILTNTLPAAESAQAA